MEFLKAAKRRTVLSELTYIALNIGLAAAILVVVLVIESPVPAIAIVLLSKWRVLAVRPRYWFANIQANTVDIIVSLSYVVLLYAAGGALFAQCLIAALYVAWLLFLKPRSKRSLVALQAGIALFFGIAALSIVSFGWPVSVVIVVIWIIGYSTARHILGSYDEPHSHFFSLIWGLILSEIGWLTYHWTIAYSLPGVGHIKLPQVAIIMLAVSFAAERIYTSYEKHNEIKVGEIILPILLSVSIVLVLLVRFNDIAGSAL
ncbi:MAG: hypothetical protein ABIQ04_03145 [Candidatus Saccharimonadales bacterium]